MYTFIELKDGPFLKKKEKENSHLLINFCFQRVIRKTLEKEKETEQTAPYTL